MYAQTIAKVKNSDGESVEVLGPVVEDWAPLNREWQSVYRPIAIDSAVETGLPIHSHGMRVTWRKEIIVEDE